MDPWKLTPARDLGLPLTGRLRSPAREPGLLDFTTHLLSASATHLYLAAVHRLRILGREHLPAAGPFILAANHNSHLDALALVSALPWRLRARASPIAAGDVFFSSVFASLFSAALLNALPLWRRQPSLHAIAELRHRLTDGGAIFIIFPEGTRSRTGDLGPFRPGLGMLAAGTAIPIIPCHLHGTHAALPPGRRIPHPHRITLHLGPPQSFPTTPNTRDGWTTLTAAIESAVRALPADA